MGLNTRGQHDNPATQPLPTYTCWNADCHVNFTDCNLLSFGVLARCNFSILAAVSCTQNSLHGVSFPKPDATSATCMPPFADDQNQQVSSLPRRVQSSKNVALGSLGTKGLSLRQRVAARRESLVLIFEGSVWLGVICLLRAALAQHMP